MRERDSALDQEVLIPDDDFVVAGSGGDDAFSGGVMKLGGIFKNKVQLSQEELALLLGGIDLRQVKRRQWYRRGVAEEPAA